MIFFLFAGAAGLFPFVRHLFYDEKRRKKH